MTSLPRTTAQVTLEFRAAHAVGRDEQERPFLGGILGQRNVAGMGEALTSGSCSHPFVATRGGEASYLTALSAFRRTMACSCDPDLEDVRASWEAMAPARRVPPVRAKPVGSPR